MMLVAYASGHKRVKEVIYSVFKKLDVGPEALFSTLGRVAARGVETLVTAEMLSVWLDELAANKKGDYNCHAFYICFYCCAYIYCMVA